MGAPGTSSGARPVRVGRDVIGPSVGTILEWYDFTLYIVLAPVLARLFFPSDEGLESLLATLGVFAIAYFARPVGAIAFGELGDRLGRRMTLIVSALMMGVPLLLIGFLPTESSIGVAAPILLLLLRIVMGLSVGGEYTGVLVYLIEIAPRDRRGLYGSLAPITAGIGSMLAIGAATLVTALLSTEQLDSWGWRLPFFLGAAIAALALAMRFRIAETPAFRHLRESGHLERHPSLLALRRARAAILVTLALAALGSVVYYVGITYVPTYLESIVGVEHETALAASTAASFLVLVAMGLAGWACDLTGRRSMLIASTAALALTSVPLFAILADGGTGAVYLGALALAVPVGAYVSVQSVAIPEQFPTVHRFSGMAIGYNVAVAVFGGLAPLAATLLVEATGDELAPSWLMVASSLAVLAVIVAAVAETARRPLREAEPATP